MSINLTKSSSISLDKIVPSLQNIHVGLGWDAEDCNGNEIDCDVSLFMIDENTDKRRSKVKQEDFNVASVQTKYTLFF